MTAPAVAGLPDWGNFYVIIGSAGAGLTGLMFVVITLGAQAGAVRAEEGLRAFVTPTLIHFCAAVLIAAIVTSPGQTPVSLGLMTGACGIVGLGFVARGFRAARRQAHYSPVTEDWIWYMLLPAVGYAAILAAAALLVWLPSGAGTYVLAAATLFLLFTGIHNAWDAAVWVAISISRPGDTGQGSGPSAP